MDTSRGSSPLREAPPAPVAGVPAGMTAVEGDVVVVVEVAAADVLLAGVVVVVVGAVVAVVVVVVVVVVVGAVVVVVDTTHVDGLVIVSLMRVTAAVFAITRPVTWTPNVTVTEVDAMTVPENALPLPRVAELPTCQKTLHAWAPLVSTTLLADALLSVDTAWKMNTELGSPSPLRVRVVVRCIVDVDL